jgi:DMSO/TMAO reductase YedYZ molybdopterin-dependent catalytic subunit
VTPHQSARRTILKGSAAFAALGVAGMPAWLQPLLAQDETLVPFTDWPVDFSTTPTPERRLIDTRTIAGAFTPADQFFTLQHYGQPVVDPATYRLKVTGQVRTPLSLSLSDLRAIGSTDLVAGFECSGNRRPLQGLCSNGRWTGVSVRRVLERARVADDAREFVFFGVDKGVEDVEFRTSQYTVEQQYGRSLTRDKALSPEPFLAWALDGAPLERTQGAPLRLIVPGWYGTANVKWLSEIRAQSDQYLGKFQARWYRSLRSETVDGETRWVERAVTRMQLKSFVAGVARTGSRHRVFGVALNDGTPLRSIQVRVDDGLWQEAVIDPATLKERYSWKLFSWIWNDATPGEHTVVSRVTDALGRVQPTLEDLEATKKTFLEDNSQFPRTVTIG